MYKISLSCPDDKKLIDDIINAASNAGAGRVGNYSRVALVLRGYGTWKSEEGSHPHIGTAGEISEVPSVRIEMQCPADCLRVVSDAIRKIHPYEEPVLEIIKLEDLT